MLHLPLSLMNRLSKTESAVFKLWLLDFKRIFFTDCVPFRRKNESLYIPSAVFLSSALPAWPIHYLWQVTNLLKTILSHDRHVFQ